MLTVSVRYVDIVLGLCLLLSQLLLCYSAVKKKRDALTLFFILSMAVLVLYWVWFAYLKYGKGESEASKEVILAIVWPGQATGYWLDRRLCQSVSHYTL